jgi:hypothetical protein
MTVSVNDDRITAAGEVTPAAATTAMSPIADPAPLGLAAFALTTFLLSAFNAGWMTKASGDAWLGYAAIYGGLVQLLAGMWEFRNKNVFGATAFGTYGAFWIGLFIWARLVAPTIKSPAVANHDLAWILLAFAIMNTILLLMSTQVNTAVFFVFLTLEATEVVLLIGGFLNQAPGHGATQIGGYIGILTALVAWYTAAAGIANGLPGPLKLPVGRPLLV